MSERCVVLDDEARRCRRTATHVGNFHGDGELSYPKVSWIRAAICEKHAEVSPFSLGEKPRRLSVQHTEKRQEEGR